MKFILLYVLILSIINVIALGFIENITALSLLISLTSFFNILLYWRIK